VAAVTELARPVSRFSCAEGEAKVTFGSPMWNDEEDAGLEPAGKVTLNPE
jgi:hypothetical protein